MVFPVMLMVLGLLPIEGEAVRPEAPPQPAPRNDPQGDQLPPGALVRLGSLRFRHLDLVHALAFSPDGKRLASACEDGSLYFWEAGTGKLIRQLSGHRRGVKSLAFSPDGKWLASAGSDHAVRLWDPVTGRPVQLPDSEQLGVASVGFSPDGKFLASMGEGDLRVWDPAQGKLLHTIKGRFELKIKFTPDGRLLTRETGGEYSFWNPGTGQQKGPLGYEGTLPGAIFAPDGKTVAGLVEPRQVLLWDSVMGKEIRRISLPFDDGVRELLFSPDGKHLLCCGLSLLDVVEVETGRLRQIFRGNYNRALALSPDGKTLALVHASTVVQLWDMETGQELHSNPGHEGPVIQLQFSRDGKKVLTTSRDRTTRLWDADTGQELQKISAEQYLVDSTLSPDDHIIAETSRGLTGKSTIRFWDAATGKLIRRITGFRENMCSLAFSPDGKRLTGFYGLTPPYLPYIRVFNVETGREQYNMKCPARQPPHGVGFSVDGRLLVSTFGEQTLRFWNDELRRDLGKVQLAEQKVTSFTFSSDGKLLAVGGNWEDIHLLETATGKELHRFKGGDAVLSPDGTMIAHNGGLSSTITGERLLELPRHGSISLVRFSSNGKRLATGGSDGTVLIWDLNAFTLKPGLPSRELTANELETLWKTLAGEDTAAAYQALWKLVATPAQALPFLEKQLIPALKPGEEIWEAKVQRLIGELDAQRFAAREGAVKQLTEIGIAVRPELLVVLANKPALEPRRRVEDLLRVLESSAEWTREPARGLGLSGPILRTARAIQVLEYIGSEEARKLLEKLAEGGVISWRTLEVQGSMQRLSSGTGKPK